jgi:hypothetical protein
MFFRNCGKKANVKRFLLQAEEAPDSDGENCSGYLKREQEGMA